MSKNVLDNSAVGAGPVIHYNNLKHGELLCLPRYLVGYQVVLCSTEHPS